MAKSLVSCFFDSRCTCIYEAIRQVVDSLINFIHHDTEQFCSVL